MRLGAVALWLCVLGGTALAASPVLPAYASVATFRVESAEVRVTFNVVEEPGVLVSNLSPDDFEVLRDGQPISRISGFQRMNDAPLSLIVLSDVSESMRRALPMENLVKLQLSQHNANPADEISFVDFGDAVQSPTSGRRASIRLTSLYDSAIEVVRRPALTGTRRAILLISDGGDNYSMHCLNDLVAEAIKRDLAIYVIDAHIKGMSTDDASLRTIADQTGGRFFAAKDNNQAEQALEEMERELRNGYVITFPAEGGGGIHRLSIKPAKPTTRRLKFFHRAGYFQPERQAAATTEIASR